MWGMRTLSSPEKLAESLGHDLKCTSQTYKHYADQPGPWPSSSLRCSPAVSPSCRVTSPRASEPAGRRRGARGKSRGSAGGPSGQAWNAGATGWPAAPVQPQHSCGRRQPSGSSGYSRRGATPRTADGSSSQSRDIPAPGTPCGQNLPVLLTRALSTLF